jgi:hypothetical protein
LAATFVISVMSSNTVAMSSMSANKLVPAMGVLCVIENR